ncbi:hypothetical protein M0R89_08325 [Halorussus limi]|uniref:Lipoprotein n=1 Tax=Halorussus limi TaxID=2938695 RepID=A0A8U0HZF5_9EURY|nr:hypothetical protein [Halorussus limi]UPV76051.1 hypothetical protein M0R89_08325 [Halorussus limi]
MKRREMLAAVGGSLAAGSLGGCLGRYEDVAGEVGDTTSDRPTDAVTTEDTRTPPDETTGEATTTDGAQTTEAGQQGALTGKTFELLDVGCGAPRGEASVSFRDGGSSVVVSGTIPGSNDCYIARLADVSYDPATRALDLTVASMAKEGAEMCAQCIVEIEYEATLSFADGGPASVTVTHAAMGESKTVATAESP